MDKKLALVIEDDAYLSDVFSEAVKKAGYNVEVLTDGKAARARLLAVAPDVVILDLHLPHVSGADLLTEILKDPIPVFPLPNLVMFPRAVQFLHLFEERYRTMMSDLLEHPADRRFIAMALLKSGYESRYHTNHAEIHPTLCVGLVVRHEVLEDGTYNLILRGICRATVRQEDRDGPYRMAYLQPLRDAGVGAGFDEADARLRLGRVLMEPSFDQIAQAQSCRAWVRSDLGVSDLVDLFAFHLLPDSEVELKQLILDQPDLPARVDMLTNNLMALARTIQVARSRWQSWPPREFAN